MMRCLILGHDFWATSPSSLCATGTSLHPMISMLRFLNVFSVRLMMLSEADGLLLGRKNTPTARFEGSVTVAPSFSASCLKSLRGI